MTEWHVSIPAWGPRCVATARALALPSLVAAAKFARVAPRFVVHTDTPTAFPGSIAGYPTEIVCLEPSQRPYWEILHDCQADAIAHAQNGDWISLLVADHVVSREFFSVCAAHLEAGVALVAGFAPRTTNGLPKAGLSAMELSEFALAHEHPLVKRLIWPDGKTNCPTAIFFRSESGAAAVHAFHLHPLVMTVREGLDFEHTIDSDLVSCFQPSEVSVIQDCSQMAIVECSPSKWDPCARLGHPLQSLSVEWLARFAKHHFRPIHRHFFKHRIMQCGEASDIPYDVPDSILRGCLMEDKSI